MVGTATIDGARRKPVKPAPPPKPKADGGEIVSASALARHLGLLRQNLDVLVASGVLEKRDGGFDLGRSRLRYINHLRSERRNSAEAAARAEHVKVKTRLLEQRLAERAGRLVPLAEYDAMIDEMCGTFLMAVHGLPAKIAGRDLALRRKIELAVLDVRREISDAALDKAKACEADA